MWLQFLLMDYFISHLKFTFTIYILKFCCHRLQWAEFILIIQWRHNGNFSQSKFVIILTMRFFYFLIFWTMTAVWKFNFAVTNTNWIFQFNDEKKLIDQQEKCDFTCQNWRHFRNSIPPWCWTSVRFKRRPPQVQGSLTAPKFESLGLPNWPRDQRVPLVGSSSY